MNVTVPHRTGSARRTTSRFVKSPKDTRGGGRASRGSLTLPSIPAAPRYNSLTGAPSKPTARQKRKQREAEVVLEEGVHHLAGENAQETLESLVKVVQLRRHGSVSPRKGRPLWERVQSIVVMANQEGLRRLCMTTPPEEVRFFFDNALTLLEPPPKPPVEGIADEFATQPALRKYLTGATLNNKAFLQQMAGDPPQAIIDTLLRALKVQGGAFTTLTLYNLAVMMISTRCFDKASEFIACCSKMIEECVKLAMPESRGNTPLYPLFLTNVAKHAIMCHHLIAAVAAWCRLRDVEVYHCQLALCCAERFLNSQHPLALRCSRRLAAAVNNSGAIMMIDETTPPRVPMLTDDLMLVEDSLINVLLQSAGGVRLPQGFLRRTTMTKSDGKRSSKSRKRSSRNSELPSIGEKRLLGQKIPRPPSSRPASSLDRVSPASRHGMRKTLTPKPPSISITAIMESFRKERSTSPTRSEGVYSISSTGSDEPPSMITFVPKPAYYCYKHIRREMRQLMKGLGEEMGRLAGDMNTSQELRRSRSASLFGAAFTDARTVTPEPSEYMVIMDKKLRRLSRIVLDKDFDKIMKLALFLQSHWRGSVDRRKYHQMVSKIRERMIQREAAERIQYAYRNHLAVREAVVEKKKLRAHRIVVERITLIQRYLYEKQSVEEWGLRCAAAYRRKIAENIENRRRKAAAIRIQSCWRMCSQRIQIHRIMKAVIRIQSLWRGYKGRMYARERRVIHRLEEKERIAKFTLHSKPIQIWWRNVLAIRAGKAIVAERQRNIALYLEEQEAAFQKDWERIKQHPNVELCMLKVLSVLRGFRCRMECAHQRKKMLILRRFFLSLVLQKRGKNQLLLLREGRTQQRALRRRREEVTDAAIRIQSLVRRWLACRQRRELFIHSQWLHYQAFVIQRAYRRHVGRRLLMEMCMEANINAEKRMISQLLHYAATKIQATWRMYHERESQKDYFRFMQRDRHIFAIRIQKAWLAYRARRETYWREMRRIESERFKQQRHEMIMAAIRIQSVARMFLTRCDLLEKGFVLSPTPAKLHRSARSIQCAWRRHAAYEYVQQLRFSRAYYDQQKVNVESLNTYATMIQALIRAKVLNPPLVENRRRELECETEEERRKRLWKLEDMYNYIIMQKNMRQARELLQSPDVPTRLECEESARAAATITTTSNSNSNNNSASTSNIAGEEEEEDSSSVAITEEELEALTELLQRCGRGAITRRTLFIQLCDVRLAEVRFEEASGRADILQTFQEAHKLADILQTFQEAHKLLETKIPKFTPEPPQETEEHTVETTTTSTATITNDNDNNNSSSKRGRTEKDIKLLVSLLQRCGRGAIARRTLFIQLCKSRRWTAAVDVQRVWRGFCARQLVEVYYEFCEQEIVEEIVHYRGEEEEEEHQS
ncbi:IQ motif [Trypanosoma melophagium]|uniref:IQ motif n=1 Tax=Trypanosoma melophagium TaxID=715481 RepID=UPI00351A2317|nr:IQ motif [Trypanosoma melophagium]